MKVLCGLFFFALLATGALFPPAGKAADMRGMADSADDISRALRSADDARTALDRAGKGSNDYRRLEQEWRDREYRLEDARLREMARETRRSEDELRALRQNGRGWDDICRSYNCRSDRFGFDRRYNQYDRDDNLRRDYYEHGKGRGHYKGTPYGPPGQYKDKDKDKHKDKKGKHDRDYDRDYRDGDRDGRHDRDRDRRDYDRDHRDRDRRDYDRDRRDRDRRDYDRDRGRDRRMQDNQGNQGPDR